MKSLKKILLATILEFTIIFGLILWIDKTMAFSVMLLIGLVILLVNLCLSMWIMVKQAVEEE